MNIPGGIETGETWNAPAQSVSIEYAKHGAAAIVFFVAEACPSGRKPWKADVVQIRKQAWNTAVKVGG